jgi:membrane protease YdiL (CAAX protease family)
LSQHILAHPRLIIPAERWMKIIAYAWIFLGLAGLSLAVIWLHSAFPIFSAAWLIIPLITLLLKKDPARVGFRAVPARALWLTALANMAGLLMVAGLVEPWFLPYQALVERALASNPPDPTFAWLVRFPGLPGWVGMAAFSGLVTIFAEELFFRGWLLHLLRQKMQLHWAVLLQALLFSLPQGIAALLLPPLPGALYLGLYSFLGIGLVNGWAAARTRSIWPGLIAAAGFNLIICFLVL